MNAILVEPEWSGMFDYAVELVKDEVPEDHGQAFVIEMLDFGKRLYENSVAGGYNAELKNGRNDEYIG